ncbi:MAG: hypothetical protein ACTS10_21870 [Kiloniellales bacterium]
MSRDKHNKETVIALLLWALGGVLLLWATYDWDLPGELGVMMGAAYFALLYWLIEAVGRHYRRREDRDSGPEDSP